VFVYLLIVLFSSRLVS